MTRHVTPWILVGQKTPAFDDDVWELYDTEKDWSQANDLSKQMPEKLHELQRLFLIEATKYNVLPLDDDLDCSPLFACSPPGNKLDHLLVQAGQIIKGSREGGFFLMIGQKPAWAVGERARQPQMSLANT